MDVDPELLERATRASSWPPDRQQEQTEAIFPAADGNIDEPGYQRQKQLLPQPEQAHYRSTIWASLTWLALIVLFGCWSYASAPGLAILGGWAEKCPPQWLYDGWPDMVLMGYQQRFDDVRPPWSALQHGEKVFKRCWHSDRNRLHQGNYLNISFSQSAQIGGANLPIMQRGRDAVKHFKDCAFPCALQNASRIVNDGLPHIGSKCRQRCGFRRAASSLASTIFDPFYDPTMRCIDTTEALPHFCPCSFKMAWHNLRRTHEHLPKPRSIHPFYTDGHSSLYRRQDIYSWWVWLWGNEFFKPWRRTSIDEVSHDELLELYAEGYWNNNMGGGRGFNMAEVRRARNETLTKQERAEIALKCDGMGPRCAVLYTLYPDRLRKISLLAKEIPIHT